MAETVCEFVTVCLEEVLVLNLALDSTLFVGYCIKYFPIFIHYLLVRTGSTFYMF